MADQMIRSSPPIIGHRNTPADKWCSRSLTDRILHVSGEMVSISTTVTGPLLERAAAQGFDFLPLKGEHDEQYEIGVAIPLRGWAVDLDTFRTNARNFFDHDVIGNSNIFIPLTIDTGRIRGWEATL